MKEKNEDYIARLTSYQTTILVINCSLMLIGGCVFGLGVLTRPILRITKPEFVHHVKWITDMMIGAGLAQLAMAGLDCFAACLKLIWVIYLGIGLTSMTVCLEIGAIGTSLHLMSQTDRFANEQVVHAWYWVECQSMANCHEAMWSYLYSYTFPQVGLTSIALFLQCLAIMYLGRLVRTIAEHVKTVHNYGEWYKENNMEKKPDPKAMEKSNEKEDEISETELNSPSNNNIGAGAGAGAGNEDSHGQYHTPSSILKTDHGYVPASGASQIDFDDSYMRNRLKPISTQQTISFNANVQVHYYDSKENLSNSEVT